MANKRIRFLKRQFFNNAWNASVQRNPTYSTIAMEGAQTGFKRSMNEFLIDMVDREYASAVSEELHYENIKALMDHGTRSGKGILCGEIYKSANAQKLLNVYLKFLWCAGLVPRPPHCPVDAVALKAAGIRDRKWTGLQDLEEYRQIVELLKTAAGTSSLAEWELDVYEKNS